METYKVKLADGTELTAKEAQGISHVVCVAANRDAAIEAAKKITRENLLSVEFVKETEGAEGAAAETVTFGTYKELRGSVTIPDEAGSSCEFTLNLHEKTTDERVTDLEDAVGTMALSMLG